MAGTALQNMHQQPDNPWSSVSSLVMHKADQIAGTHGAYFGAASSSGAARPGDVQSAERFVMAALQAPTLVMV